MKDLTRFPSPIYQETVLEPIFEAFKENYYDEMMAINYAHAVILVEQGIITKEEGQQIVGALQEIEQQLVPESLEYTGEYEDLFFYIEKQLISKLGIEVAGKLHTGRSRNDINITLFKMKTKQHLLALLNEVVALQETLLQIAEDNKETLVIAYTHGQPAQPTTFGHYLGALIEILGRDVDRLLNAYSTTDQCSMGAAAITTSGFPLNREKIATLLGFSQSQENSYGCIAAVDYLMEVYSALRILFINLGRFAQDLDFWTSFEIGHLYVPNEFVQVSSIMPQKRNPVAIEHIRIQASIVVGLCDTMVSSMRNTPFADMNDAEDPIQVVGFDAFNKARRCLKLVKGFVAGLQVDEAKVKKHMAESFVTITELADSLVREENISFRAAHEVASILVRNLIAEGKNLRSVKYGQFEAYFQEVTGRKPHISPAKLAEVLDPTYFVQVRNCQGGPALPALKASLNKYRRKLDDHQATIERLARQEQGAKKLLQTEVHTVIGI